MTDPVEALLRSARDTLLLSAAGALLVGLLGALCCASTLFLCATRLPPRIAPGQVWARWRQVWPLWLLLPSLWLVASLLLAGAVGRLLGTRSLFWLQRTAELERLGWLGAAVGYLCGLFVVVAVAALRRRLPRAAGP